MIERLLPPEISAVETRRDVPDAFIFPGEAALIEGAVAPRFAEFATTRHCARLAIQRLGIAEGPILRGLKREPLWPAGIVGSLTHCTGYRAAAVARAGEMLSIGIDAEPHEPIHDRVVERILVEEERAWVAGAPANICWERLIFSAKESVYKAWFPLTSRWLDFPDATIETDPGSGSFTARLLVVAPPGIPNQFRGRYLIEDGLVLTAIAVPHQA